jgi:hypothetical protein
MKATLARRALSTPPESATRTDFCSANHVRSSSSLGELMGLARGVHPLLLGRGGLMEFVSQYQSLHRIPVVDFEGDTLLVIWQEEQHTLSRLTGLVVYVFGGDRVVKPTP